MTTNGVRAVIYLRVSRDDQTTENQRIVLARVAEHRDWTIVPTCEDRGISGANGRDQRPVFNQTLNSIPASRNVVVAFTNAAVIGTLGGLKDNMAS
jgi:DNA invertase Pin-like site-specific DNA recombinase